ncbi:MULTISPECIES: hypothetical protein [Burkholderiaceae]|nr:MULTISPECIES: hypothetical protein [Burkholderiaceae]
MFDVIPYWMWAVSLLVLALMCGAVLSVPEPRERGRPLRRIASARARRL